MATQYRRTAESDEIPANGGLVMPSLMAVVALALGLAGGFVFGNVRGKSSNARETAEAITRMTVAEESKTTLAVEMDRLANALAEEKKIRTEKATEREVAAANMKQELQAAKAKIPAPTKAATTADGVLASIKTIISESMKTLPNAEKAKVASIQVAIEGYIAKNQKNIPRPDTLIEGTINSSRSNEEDKIGLHGSIQGSIFVEKVIDDDSAILKVTSAISNGTGGRPDFYDTYYYAQRFPTKGLVDQKHISSSPAWVIVGTKKVPLTNGSTKTMWVIETFRQ